MLALFALSLSPWQAAADAFADENFSATATFTSDYVFRGVSQADEDPAVQASLDWGYNNFYAGIWGSNVELASVGGSKDGATHSVEYDLYFGYAGSAGPVDYDAGVLYYWYPNDRGAAEADYVELALGLSHTLAGMALEPTVGVFAAWSPDYTLEDDDSYYLKGSLALQLSEHVGVDFAAGTIDVDGGKGTPGGYGYTHYEVGLAAAVKGFDIDLRYHNNNEQKSVQGFGDIIDDRVVLTVSRSFGS